MGFCKVIISNDLRTISEVHMNGAKARPVMERQGVVCTCIADLARISASGTTTRP